MRLGWGARQAVIFCLLAIFLVAISWLLGPISVARLAVNDATDVSKLITQSLLLQIGHLAREKPADPLRAIRADPRIDLVLQAATAQAPGVVFVAICDSASTAIAHTNPDRVGTRMDALPALPQGSGFWDSIALVGHLRTAERVYEVRTPLLISGKPFATIRVGIAGGLLRERVNEAFRTGLLVAWIQIVLAIAVGFALARVTTQRLRQLEAGVTALREGRFDTRIPDSGVDEFSRLARDLNLLSEQFQQQGRDRDSSLGQVQRTVELLGEGVLTLGPEMEVVLVNGPTGKILELDIARARGKRLGELLPDGHPVRVLVDRVMAEGAETLSIQLPPLADGTVYAGDRAPDRGRGRPLGRRPGRVQGSLGARGAALARRSLARARPSGTDGRGGGARDPQSAADDLARTRRASRRGRSDGGPGGPPRADRDGGDPAAAAGGQRLPEGRAAAAADPRAAFGQRAARTRSTTRRSRRSTWRGSSWNSSSTNRICPTLGDDRGAAPGAAEPDHERHAGAPVARRTDRPLERGRGRRSSGSPSRTRVPGIPPEILAKVFDLYFTTKDRRDGRRPRAGAAGGRDARRGHAYRFDAGGRNDRDGVAAAACRAGLGGVG